MSHPNIYRYKFLETTTEQMDYFAKLHRYDDRVTFKDAWERWTASNASMIAEEQQRHNDAGYKGDVVDKMYKSVRYYYRKKKENTDTKAETSEKQNRREYVALDRTLLKIMDEHISTNTTSKPSTAFDDFCENHKENIITEAIRLKKYLEADEITLKIKKTYKNRFFIALREI